MFKEQRYIREEKKITQSLFVKSRKKKLNLLCSLEIENLALDRYFHDYYQLPCHLAGSNRRLKPILGNFPSQS